MQQQEPLFYESGEEAIRAAISNSGKAFKQVAAELWPAMKIDTAYARLMAALNPEKNEKLTLDEVVVICRVTGRADPLLYLCQELSYSRPRPVSPVDAREAMLREIRQSQQQLASLLGRLDRFESGGGDGR